MEMGIDALRDPQRAAICSADEPWGDSPVDSGVLKHGSRQPVTEYRVSRRAGLYILHHLRPHPVRNCHLCRGAYRKSPEYEHTGKTARIVRSCVSTGFFSGRNWNFCLSVCLDRQRRGPISHKTTEEKV